MHMGTCLSPLLATHLSQLWFQLTLFVSNKSSNALKVYFMVLARGFFFVREGTSEYPVYYIYR